MDEAPRKNDFFSFSQEKDVHYHPSKNNQIPEKNLFTILVDRIKKSFQPAKRDDGKLSGRVQQLHRAAGSVLEKLKEIKLLLKISLDSELFSYVETLMEPMTRDVAYIQNLLTQKASVVHQAKAFKKYSNWMIKAELWMDLEKKVHDTDAIIATIIRHATHEADEQIDQDLQVIKDYEEYLLDALPLNEQEAAELKKHLSRDVGLQLLGLENLKEKPALGSLQEMLEWKAEVDKKRSKFFERALQLIDEIIHAISPSSSSEEEHDYLVEVLTQIAFLEEEIPELIAEINEGAASDPVRKKMTLSKINSFEQEMHELNLDLRLTQELADRLQILMTKLEEACKLIQEE